MYDTLEKYKSQKENFENWYCDVVGGGETDLTLIMFRDEA
jgi:hypothetical protein